ncbi:MAG TPA: efflux RND transporter periplasmic adaptor subunit [Allosphingosinicella sp.]|nr:efflux RND transporter periplasmic adaptor subunit [Allosphingosinicella sp.]
MDDSAPTADENKAAAKAKRRRWLGLLAAVVVVGGIAYFFYWLLVLSHYESTDNAYVGAEIAMVTPQVNGAVTEIRVRETEPVKAGQVLVVIDPTDARLTLASAEADLARAERQYQQTSATGRSLAAQVQASAAGLTEADAREAKARADLARAASDLRHRQNLAPTGAVAGEELTSARDAFATAQSELRQAEAARAQATASETAAASSREANEALTRGPVSENPIISAARAKVEQARIDLSRTIIRAPVAGVVAKRQVQVGQRVQVGEALMSIVPIQNAYVDANFKEVQLKKVHVGQAVELTSDIYGGDVVFHGRVIGFSGGTGSAFSLVPAQNATGNWIKIVQRLPVRIALDPAELRAHPLRVGLSMKATIDISR